MNGRRGKEAASLKTIPLVPTKSQINTAFVGIAALGAATALFPGFFFIAAFVMPVLVCPLFGKPDKKTAWVLGIYTALPAVCAFIRTQDLFLSLCILCIAALPVLVTRLLLREKHQPGLKNQKEFLAAFVFSELLLLFWLGRIFPQGIIAGLRDSLLGFLEKTPYKVSLLQMMAGNGMLPVPDVGLEGAEAERELMLLLRSRLEEGLRILFAKLLTWVPLVASLFTLLRVTWLNGSFLLLNEENERQVTVARPVVFSMLALRTRTVLLLCVVSELSRMLSGSASTFGMLALLAGWTCQGILNLAGTASFLRMIRGEERRVAAWKGLLAGVLFTIVPDFMMICLMLEHFRLIMRKKSTDNHKEEEP